ncbi:MAG: ATP-dependent RecD-like DNA helicase [Verrucomicrobiales bacterium]|nr:ATP-dependent RecD-like DNA helicase [Verrucomicrobiales bacterium]
MQNITTATAANRESISGLIERVTFFNEETGFAVLRLKAERHRDLVTVTGSLASVTAGEWLIAEGNWVRDKEYGLQFKADTLKCTAPTTKEGIEKYLGSGMVKGIGPTYAKKLVERFGKTIFDIIENFSKRLEEVDGIGPERRKRIKGAWIEQKFIREIMVFLHSHGVSTSRAVRIYKCYGAAAIEKVRNNPYTLARDIHGIGFKTADQIAQNLGIGRDSILRAEAGLTHALSEAVERGSCALPREMLVEHAIKLLQVDEKVIHEALERLVAKGDLIQEPIAGEKLVFLPQLRNAEINIATRLLRLVTQSPAYPRIDFEKAVSWSEANTGTQLAAGQREALRSALQSRVLILTGGPGVGKTTLINSILRILTAKKVTCVLCAPTGRAAKRMSEATGFPAQTIHRLLGWQRAGEDSGRTEPTEAHPLNCDLLVVDEFSMVDVLLLSRLLRKLSEHCSLLLVGDADQLPSIGPGSVLSDLIQSGAFPVVRLTEVFRQAAQSWIIRAAHAVNGGALPELPGRNEASDFYFIEREAPEEIAHTLIEIVQARIPRKLECDAQRDVQVLCPMNRGSLGVLEMNLRLQSALNPARSDEPVVEKFGWQFRLRDRVIQTENNYDKEVFNGDIGQVVKINPTESEVVVRFDARDVTYDFAELDEISLAYAITIHKAQGSEFPAVVIPMATQQYMLLQRNLVYTGITRGKRMVVLIGQKRAFQIAVQNHQTSQRFSGLQARLQSERILIKT